LLFAFKNPASSVNKKLELVLTAAAITIEPAIHRPISKRICIAVSDILYIKSTILIRGLFCIKSSKVFFKSGFFLF